MITGDYHHTAIAVAKSVGMLRADREIVVIDAVQQCQPSPPSSPRRVAFVSPSPDQLPAPLHHSPSSRLRSTFLRSALMSPDRAAAPSVMSSSFYKPHGATQAVPADASEHASSSGPRPLLQTALPSPAVTNVHASSSAFPSKPHGAQHGSSNGSPQGQLRFVRGLAGEEVEVGSNEAITAMVSGQVQCAVTGSAFDHILHISDVSVLETMMRSVLVFARMKPHQKGEVMDLLSVRGLHQMHQGHPRHLQVSPLRRSVCDGHCLRLCGHLYICECMCISAPVHVCVCVCMRVCVCRCSSVVYACICFHACLRCACGCLFDHAHLCTLQALKSARAGCRRQGPVPNLISSQH